MAAEPKGTALATIDWAESTATLVGLKTNINDADIVAAALKVEKLGIDCALGWPAEFVDFLVSHNRTDAGQAAFTGDLALRRELAYRETDREVRKLTGRWPLSVSTDRLGMTAIRCAGILSQLAEAGVNVDRSGVGRVVEVYPGATLRGWGLDTAGYRTSAQVREKLLANLCAEAPWLSIGVHGALMVSSGDAFDAVVAALAARAAYLGGYHKPANHQLDAAKVEGWLALPTLSLGELIAATNS